MIPYKQLSLADIFTDCQEKFENNKPGFLLLETHIDISEDYYSDFISKSFLCIRLNPCWYRATYYHCSCRQYQAWIQNCKRGICEFRNYLFIL